MAPKWTDKLNLKFVELYKEQQCLWDQLHPLYKDKNARESALVSIVEDLNVQGFGVAEVKAKIKAFRGTFNIEFAKQQKSAKSGSADVYVPTLKWFNAMKEVMEKGTQTRNTTSMLMPGVCKIPADKTKGDDDICTSLEPEVTLGGIEESEEQIHVPVPDDLDYSGSRVRSKTSGDYLPKKKFKPKSRIQQIASTAQDLNSLKELVFRKSDDNEWDIYGRHVATQIKLLSPVQALTAQMEINSVLTKCRFNDLYRKSTTLDQGIH